MFWIPTSTCTSRIVQSVCSGKTNGSMRSICQKEGRQAMQCSSLTLVAISLLLLLFYLLLLLFHVFLLLSSLRLLLSCTTLQAPDRLQLPCLFFLNISEGWIYSKSCTSASCLRSFLSILQNDFSAIVIIAFIFFLCCVFIKLKMFIKIHFVFA